MTDGTLTHLWAVMTDRCPKRRECGEDEENATRFLSAASLWSSV